MIVFRSRFCYRPFIQQLINGRCRATVVVCGERAVQRKLSDGEKYPEKESVRGARGGGGVKPGILLVSATARQPLSHRTIRHDDFTQRLRTSSTRKLVVVDFKVPKLACGFQNVYDWLPANNALLNTANYIAL
jgi:hypothetical protein